MHSEPQENLDIDEIFETYKERDESAPRIDVIIEHYLSVVNKLKKDLNVLKNDLSQQQRENADNTFPVEEYQHIQLLSSIITQDLDNSQVAQNLEEVSRKFIPLLRSAIFIWDGEHFVPAGKQKTSDLKLIATCAHDEGIVRWLYEQKQPVVVPLSDFLVYDKLRKKKGNVIIVPMLNNDQGIGIYIIMVDKDKSSFSIRDLELLNVLTQQATLAILFNRMNEAIEKKERLLKNIQNRMLHILRLATIGELAGGFAHEINNPLQIIMGNVQMARMGHKLEKSLEVIEKQSVRIANIVRGLLNMAQQNQESTSELFEINPLIVNTVNLIRGQLEKREIDVALELKNKIPAVQGSSVYFQQILLNFILHAKMQIGRTGTIQISTRVEENEWIILKISDTGVPMPPEYIDKVLNPFSELENSEEVNLGLTVSVQMIQEKGGDVQFKPRKKTGNLITIRIPTKTIDKQNVEEKAVSTA
jgi:signal transduction histidine kinase